MQTLYRGYTIDATHRISKNNIIKCILQKILGIVRPLCFVVGGRNHCHWFHIHMITTLASSGIQIGKTYIARSTFFVESEVHEVHNTCTVSLLSPCMSCMINKYITGHNIHHN